jgi:hypothetical protein
MTNFNSNPYYDDFSRDKDYYQILFKPGVSVQARELTQIQSILQNQIKTFGNHVFRQGSVVIPGNISSDLAIQYIKLASTPVLATLDLTTIVGTVVTGSTSGVSAVIKAAIRAEGSDPATIYVAYLSGNGGFRDGEEMTIGGPGGVALQVAATAASGIGATASISRGVYYVNGLFANVDNQTTVISKYSPLPNCHVLLEIIETIITSDTDPTLLDPSNGSSNFSAPGADRFKLSLKLVTLPLDLEAGQSTYLTENYIELMRFNRGVLEAQARYPLYSELEKSLARRTYDESGNYVSYGMDISMREHLRTTRNGGLLVPESGGSAAKFVVQVNPGKAYVQGFEQEIISPKYIALDKARTPAHIKDRSNVILTPSFGQYFFVSNLRGLPNFNAREIVNLYDATFGTAGRAIIGTARAASIDYYEAGIDAQHALYNLVVTDITMNGGKSITDVGSIDWVGGSSSVTHRIISDIPGDISTLVGSTVTGQAGRVARVWNTDRNKSTLYVIKDLIASAIPLAGDNITNITGTYAGVVSAVLAMGNYSGNASIIKLPFTATFKAKQANGTTSDMTYKVYQTFNTTVDASGNASVSVVGGTFDPREQGNLIIAGPLGVLSYTLATVSAGSITVTGTGLANGTALSIVASVTKTGVQPKTKVLTTGFSEGFNNPGNIITLTRTDVYRIVSILNTTGSALGDITNLYNFDNGQRDYAYMRGRLIANTAAVITGLVTVQYEYFAHSGGGDYFSADSYVTAFPSEPDYYPLIPTYSSKIDGTVYDLVNCLDFRPTVGANDLFNGPSSSASNYLQPDTRISSSFKYYVPRIDILTLTKSGEFEIESGIPDENPVSNKLTYDTMLMAEIYVPAYTLKVSDIKTRVSENQGYTMAEISELEARISRVEEFALLTQSEKSSINYEIVDAATGLSRFKSGYLVDTFDNPDTISDIYNQEFSVTYTENSITPKMESHLVDMALNTNGSSVYQVTGSATEIQVITLPYTEVSWIEQPQSSRITNLNPFLSISWVGTMTVSPSFDNWEAQPSYLPTVMSSTSTTVEVRRPFGWQPPDGALVQFLPAPPPIITTTTVVGPTTFRNTIIPAPLTPVSQAMLWWDRP